jgi:hypothetical protein
MTMTLPTNDFANRELSIEELEAVAAGGFFGDAWNFVKHEASAVVHWVESPKGLSTIATVAGAVVFSVFGASGGRKLN